MSNVAAVGGTLTSLVGLAVTVGILGAGLRLIDRAIPDGRPRRRGRDSFFGGFEQPRVNGRQRNNRRNSPGIFDVGRSRQRNPFAVPSFNSPRRGNGRPRQRLTGSNIFDPRRGGF